MTITQEQAIRKTFLEAGIPDYVGVELTAAIPYFVALLDKQRVEGTEFPHTMFRISLGDKRYILLFEEEE